MAFDRLDGHEVLYIAENDAIDRYVWNANGTVGARTVVVSGLPAADPSGDEISAAGTFGCPRSKHSI